MCSIVDGSAKNARIIVREPHFRVAAPDLPDALVPVVVAPSITYSLPEMKVGSSASPAPHARIPELRDLQDGFDPIGLA
jgi:hypothetical protein